MGEKQERMVFLRVMIPKDVLALLKANRLKGAEMGEEFSDRLEESRRLKPIFQFNAHSV